MGLFGDGTAALSFMLLHVLFLSGALAACPNVGLFITTPQRMEALSGSCLQIPCNFSTRPDLNLDGNRPVAIWNKYRNNVVFNSKNEMNKYPMKITGDLGQKNCTTLFSNLITSYTARYYFRFKNTGFQATAFCDPLRIIVKDSPPRPRIEISGDLREKQSVTITCSALTPCPLSPPKLTWNLQQDPHNTIEENTDRTFTTKIQMNITLSDTHDGFNISCSANYPVDGGEKTAEERKTLSVSYAPKDTSVSISPSGLVSAGSWVNLTCSSRAKPPISSFTWFKSSRDGPIRVAEGDFYSFNVTCVTDGGVYSCLATNYLGNETSEIHLTVEVSPLSPRIEIPGDLKEKQSVTITCSALTPCPLSPPKLTWNLQQDPHNTREENTDRTFTTKIQMNITLSDTHDGFNISCSANYSVDGGEKTAEERKTLSVSYAPKNTSVSISPSVLVSAGSWVNLTCSSRAKPPVSNFTWFKSSRDGPIRVAEGDFYRFNVTDGGVYFCVAINDLGPGISSEILNIKEPDGSLQWPILGGIIGIILLICLAVCVCILVYCRRLKSTQQQSQSQTGEEVAMEQPARKNEEDIHYQEIDFSKRTPQVFSAPERDSRQQQDTLYAQVKVTQAANSLTQTADRLEDLYAQVKKE